MIWSVDLAPKIELQVSKCPSGHALSTKANNVHTWIILSQGFRRYLTRLEAISQKYLTFPTRISNRSSRIAQAEAKAAASPWARALISDSQHLSQDLPWGVAETQGLLRHTGSCTFPHKCGTLIYHRPERWMDEWSNRWLYRGIEPGAMGWEAWVLTTIPPKRPQKYLTL